MPTKIVSLSEDKPERMRWVMIGFAFTATVINYLDRQTLSVVAPALREEFGMSNEDYGFVLSAFMLAYTVLIKRGMPTSTASQNEHW